MKKIFNILLIAAATLGIASSCSDVPMPYDIHSGDSSFGKKLPYKNASLSSFSTYNVKEYAAWSQGSSYTQATGYQAWDGSSTKSNKEVESYLISPALNTTCESGKVRISFDHTLRYSNNVTGWKDYHRIYISKTYDGISNNFNLQDWTELDYTPAASTYSDWTLYSSGYINVPEEFVNHDSVYVAFYFYAPASASTTWELENFLIEEGDAGESGEDPVTPTENVGTKESPLSVADAKSQVGSTGYVTGYIVGYVDGTKLEEGAKFEAASASETEVLIADAADCKDATLCFPVQLPAGDIRTALNPATASNIGKKVTVYGSIETYFGTTGMKSTSWAKIDGKEIGVDPDAPVTPAADPKGEGTQASPFNVSAAIAYVNKLPSDAESDEVMYVEGIVCNEPNINTTQYYNATFKISDDGVESTDKVFTAYQVYGLGGQKITDANYVKKGDKVILCGKIVNYKGNTPETIGKGASYIYSLNGKTEGKEEGGSEDTPSGSSEGITISGTTVTLTNSAVTAGTESISIDLSTLELKNATDMDIIRLSDGSSIEFAAGTNKNTPKYYDATKGARVYANNTITFYGKSEIATIVMECDSYNGTDYVGNTTATIAVDGKTIVYTNASDSAGVQLRVKVITITYAK